MARKYAKGFYFVRNPEKYDGNPNDVIYRSSWEFRFMHWADENKQVIEWSSERVVIPYVSPIDNRFHRYFMDFKIKLINNKGETKTYLVEIKPDTQTRPPKPRKKTQAYLNEIKTWGVNEAKWIAAKKYASDRGIEFVIITEHHLNLA